jgi:thioredoxin reductase (NADPH)
MSARAFTHDCIIIGGGPAGLVAGIYLRRFHRRTLVIDRGEQRVKCIPKIRNLVGYAEGISGRALLHRLRQQATRYNLPIENGTATVRRIRSGFEVKSESHTYFSPKVILATGLKDLQPKNVDFFSLCKQGGLAYCPICDGYDHSDEEIGVFVDSPKGFQKLNFLYNFSPYLHLILLQKMEIPARHKEKIRKLKIKVHHGAIEQLRYDLDKKKLFVKLQKRPAFSVRMAYVALGCEVNTLAFQHLNKLRRTKDGFIIVNAHQETSIRGLFAIGDCVHSLAQVSVAVGQAAIAATAVHNQLSALQSLGEKNAA